MYCGCKMNWEVTLGLPYAISLQHQSKPLPATVSPVVCNQGNHSVVNLFLQCTLLEYIPCVQADTPSLSQVNWQLLH